MAKKKTALSSLDKAFAIAGRFPSMVPGEFREELVRFRSLDSKSHRRRR